MDSGEEKINCEKAREFDLVQYLCRLGLEPKKIRGNNYWYLSPFRNEHTPSFKVNRKINRWYDFGEGKGGNIIDFGIRYHNCPVTDFLLLLSGGIILPQYIPHIKNTKEEENKITVIGEFILSSSRLLGYLLQRKISREIARRFCVEVHFTLNGKTCYAIGFKNDSGGYELRSKLFKLSSSPKDYTTIRNGSKKFAVFEGFMDFLSFLVIHPKQAPAYDFLILNSIAFFEKAMPFMMGYDKVELYLDRDTTGQNCSLQAMKASRRFKDKSGFYKGYKDLNNWLADSPAAPGIKDAPR
jgi:hypothetical protein